MEQEVLTGPRLLFAIFLGELFFEAITFHQWGAAIERSFVVMGAVGVCVGILWSREPLRQEVSHDGNTTL